MTVNKFIRTLFNLKELIVSSYNLQIRKRTLTLWVKPFKNGCLCPTCRRRGKIVNQLKVARRWLDLPVYGCTVVLEYCPREIQCPIHGRIQENIPWAESYSHITYRFEFAMLVYCQLMTQKAAARLLHISTSTLSDMLHRTITRIRDGHKIRGLKTLGVDEISYCKGRKFITVVYDLDRSRVVWVGKGKGRKTIDKFFNECLSDYQKKKIKWASCDMSKAYIGAIEHHCKNVKLVLDRFHIVKALNEAVDQVRKDEWRDAIGDKRKAIKGLRWLLYRHSSNRTKEQTRILNSLKKGNRRIHRAWILKDEFERFWEYKYPTAAENFLKRWTTTAMRSRIESIKKFVKTIRKYSDKIITFIGSRLTNAIGEGLNRIMKIIKNRASGFRSLNAFIDMIFLVVGDLDIPAQIPKKFHTI